jgi:hypothetical protein
MKDFRTELKRNSRLFLSRYGQGAAFLAFKLQKATTLHQERMALMALTTLTLSWRSLIRMTTGLTLSLVTRCIILIGMMN